jgi:hypothetical protein
MRARCAPTTLAATHWSNGAIETQFRTIDGLSIRFAESEDADDYALLLSPWLHERLPNSKLDIVDAGQFTWEDCADEYAALVSVRLIQGGALWALRGQH